MENIDYIDISYQFNMILMVSLNIMLNWYEI